MKQQGSRTAVALSISGLPTLESQGLTQCCSGCRVPMARNLAPAVRSSYYSLAPGRPLPLPGAAPQLSAASTRARLASRGCSTPCMPAL